MLSAVVSRRAETGNKIGCLFEGGRAMPIAFIQALSICLYYWAV